MDALLTLGTRAGTLGTATTAVITTRGAASLNKIKTYATHTDQRLMTALNNLGPRPAYAGGITPGRVRHPVG